MIASCLFFCWFAFCNGSYYLCVVDDNIEKILQTRLFNTIFNQFIFVLKPSQHMLQATMKLPSNSEFIM